MIDIENYISERIDFLFAVEAMREKLKDGGLIPYSKISKIADISNVRAVVFNDKKDLKDDAVDFSVDFSKAIGFDDDELKYYPTMNLITSNPNCYSCVEHDLHNETWHILVFVLHDDETLGINVALNTDGTFGDFEFYL